MRPGTGPGPAEGALPVHPAARRAYANAALNLLAGVLPIPVALLAIPAVISGYGVDRYGVLATAGVVLAYFALLDFGLARAATRFLARSLEAGDARETATVFWTVVAMASAIGVLVAALLFAVAGPLVREVLRVPPAVVGEAVAAFRLLAVAAPFTIVLPALLSALEGWRRFDLVAAIQVPAVTAALIAPLLVLPWTTRPAAAIGATAAVQALACGAALVTCLRAVPALRHGATAAGSTVRRLLGFGGWVAVSNVVGPLMVNLDRVAIGAVLSVGAVTFYAAPYGLVTQLSLVPSSLMRALFPLFSADRSVDVKEGRPLAVDGARAVALVMGPAAVFLVAVAPDLLRVWLGAGFVGASTATLQWLAVGVAVNAMAMVPFWLLYGIGRPDVCAKFHLVELALYVPALLLLLGRLGITGAALAWTGRVTLDAVLLAWAVSRLVGAAEHGARLRRLTWYGVGLVIALALARLGSAGLAAAAWRLPCAAALTGGAAVFGWRLLLSSAERAAVRADLAGRMRRRAS
jgi:O-antigen/teichoic acid export membrane protein